MLKQVRQNPCGRCERCLGALRKGKLLLQPPALRLRALGLPARTSPKAAGRARPPGSARGFSLGPRKAVCGHPPSASPSRGCLLGSCLAGGRSAAPLGQVLRFSRGNATIRVFISLTVNVGNGTCCPGKLWVSQPWKCSRPGWMRPGGGVPPHGRGLWDCIL